MFMNKEYLEEIKADEGRSMKSKIMIIEKQGITGILWEEIKQNYL